VLKSLFSDLINLIYPRTCAACSKTLYKHEKIICTSCLLHLPKTFFHKDENNPLFQLFWGKIPIEMITSYYFFNKGNKVQNLIHLLKYKNRPDIGVYIGQLYGDDLKTNHKLSDLDVIIPVPLHKSKLKKRGFNQAEAFADGLSLSLNIPVDSTSFIRNTATETQTKKTKLERWENVKNKFSVIDTEKIKGKHILLVDDVITTGATLEACAQILLQTAGVRISLASMAVAHY